MGDSGNTGPLISVGLSEGRAHSLGGRRWRLEARPRARTESGRCGLPTRGSWMRGSANKAAVPPSGAHAWSGQRDQGPAAAEVTGEDTGL